MLMKERDEELALFLEMRRREKENEKNNLLLLQNSDELDGSNLESNGVSSPISKMVTSAVPRKAGADEFLDSENEKSDYDWLLTPPDTPLFPALDKESQISVKSERENSTARSTALKPRPANVQLEPASKNNLSSKHHAAAMPGFTSSTTANNRKTSSAGGTTSATSRSVTPSGRPTLPSTTRNSRPSTPTSRATVTTAKPVAPPPRSSTPTGTRATVPPVRSSTPTGTRATVPPVRSSTPTGTRATAPPVRSSTPTGTRATAPPVRSSTPTGTRATARASTPTSRPSLTAPKTTRRSSTPTLRSSTPSNANGVSAPASRSSSASKARPAQAKNPVQSRGSSPSAKSRPWEPSQMPGFSLDAPPNLKTSLPERPTSVSRTRPGPPNSRTSSLEAAGSIDGKSKRQSVTPSRGRASTGVAQSNHSSTQALNRSRFIDGDNDSPVVVGSKMVERVVNMRKLGPPKHEDRHSAHSSSGKSSLSESSGFGRTLSKKSLDMAMRHMDIRRSIKGSLKPLVTNIPASSMYSVRSTGSSNSRTMNVSDSPLATSSTASSEPSVNFNSISYDGSEIEENDLASDRGNSSPVSHHSR
ncbi:mucin-5AC [Neltuma alba]|uniref:mucin-5AC n=1 Tax=Neltuma alba TaxID=207710 RepID=UPI0010A563FC|nr:mucin-5AC-like [Prosopis alba]